METSDYQELADACLKRIEDWIEDFDPDELDFTPSDGVVTMEFADGARFVLNRQSAASQVWLAAGARAWHFNFDADAKEWRDDKEGNELFARIAEVVSAKLGRTVTI
ncbi:MAG: CyaY protein [Planctomycetota bacterium]|jgi:CyaY protein